MGEIGKPSRTRNSSSFQEPRRIFTLLALHCELNGPNRVSLSPVSGVGDTVMERLALAGLSRVLPESNADPLPSCLAVSSSNCSTSPGLARRRAISKSQ